MHDRCNVCGLQYLRDQGDLWGYLLLVDRAVFLFPLIAALYLGYWNPYALWYWVCVGLLVIAVIYTTPHRNGISVGIEYYVRMRSGEAE